jgi:hypothetical protein
MKVLIAFNAYLKEFCEKLLVMIPDNENVKLINNAFHVGLIANKSSYIKHFHEHVHPFHADIIKRNESLFLNHDFSMIPSVSDHVDDIDEMKHLWQSGISTTHKNIIWDYLKVLSTLSMRHYS